MSNGGPVNIRRNIENYKDPYIQDAGPNETLTCSECKAVYHDQRWYLESQAKNITKEKKKQSFTICPACLKIGDKMPGGIVHCSGGFVGRHKDEILNLIRNENDRAGHVNPLERVMDIESIGTGMDILTTNEKLAQRIGKALHRAYDGVVTYSWSQDIKLARVNWTRE